jgi:membrane protein YqaA with SNARE-associated domain
MLIVMITYSIDNNSIFAKYGLIGLFFNGLLSSIIPIPTELTISGLILAGESKLLVFIILTSSSILGAFIAYYIGYSGNKFIRRLHKSPSKRSQDRSLLLLEKYGWIILFFSPWIPIMGDFIPIIAGIKKYNLEIFSISIILGKAVKALAIVFLSSWILPLFFP